MTIETLINKTDFIDSIHYTSNPIKEIILSSAIDDSYYDRKESETPEEEIKIILGFIKDQQTMDYWGNSLIYTHEQLKFYDKHQEFIDEYVTNQAEQMGENFLSFLGSMNARFTESIDDLDGIKTLMMVYSYESSAFNLYEELDHALNSGDFKKHPNEK